MDIFNVTFPYDTTYLKQLERHNLRTLVVRILLMMCCGVAGYLFLSDPVFLIWGVVYAVTIGIWVNMLRSTPKYLGRLGFAVLLVASLAYGISYLWIAWYAWTRPEPVMHYVALVATFGAMLNSLSVRSDDLLMSLTDGVLATLTAGWMVYRYALGNHPWPETLFLAVLLGTLIVYLILSMRDATRTRARLRMSQQAEVEQAKMQSLGQLTGGVAHDFNNLLTVIIGNLDLRREANLDPEDEEELLAEVYGAARKASNLTSHLLAYSRRSPLEEQIVDVRSVIDSAGVLLRRLLPVTHELNITSADILPRIKVDVGKLETVVVNLVMNARDSMPAGGAIDINVAMRHFDKEVRFAEQPNCVAVQPLPPGRYVELRVEDAGTGIPARIMNSVLEPYFTTKPVGKGSGLGLPMALGFAEQSGGGLSISSIEGQGTMVSLWFPIAAHNAAAEAPAHPHEA